MKPSSLLFGFAVAIFGLAVCGCNNAPKAGEELTPEQLAEYSDVPLYPNAKVPDGESHVPKPDDAGDMHYELVQVTGDSPQGVSTWYEKKMGWRAQGSNTSWNLMGTTKQGNDATIGIFLEGDTTKIVINSLAHKKR